MHLVLLVRSKWQSERTSLPHKFVLNVEPKGPPITGAFWFFKTEKYRILLLQILEKNA
jgi:hypothetical protein